MESIKSATEILPFLERYPFWVRVLFAVWLIISAVVIISFVLAPHQNAIPSPPKPPEPDYIKLTIIETKQYAKVEQVAIVRGKTNMVDRNIYLIVIPSQTGDRFVVDGPLSPDSKGSWYGRARFGEGKIGVGQKFIIHAVSTAQELSEGVISDLPDDSYNSAFVEVERLK